MNKFVYTPNMTEIDKCWWGLAFERELKVDPNAAASILSYYLEKLLGKPCTIFCPLGYELYEKLGSEMATSKAAFEAAKEVGLLADGVGQYVRAALSNADCWECMAEGVAVLVHDSKLECFVPFREGFLARNLLRLNDSLCKSERSWNEAYIRLRDELGDNWRGY